jgi:uncharacterized coiled-coil protein SlyX
MTLTAADQQRRVSAETDVAHDDAADPKVLDEESATDTEQRIESTRRALAAQPAVISSLKANLTALTQKLDAINALEADARAAIDAARTAGGNLTQQQLALTAEVKEAEQELAKQVGWTQQLAGRLDKLLERLDDLRMAGPTRAPPALYLPERLRRLRARRILHSSIARCCYCEYSALGGNRLQGTYIASARCAKSFVMALITTTPGLAAAATTTTKGIGREGSENRDFPLVRPRGVGASS